MSAASSALPTGEIQLMVSRAKLSSSTPTMVNVSVAPFLPLTVTFGATVTVRGKKGATETFTIVGVDELNFARDTISWISPVGKALLAADMGDWIKLEDGRSAKVVKIEFQTESD